MNKQDFIINMANKMVVYTSEIAGYEYDLELQVHQNKAYAGIEKFEYLLQELKKHISSYNLLDEVRNEAIEQGAIERLV